MTIKEISHEVYYNMGEYSQIVIDIVEEVSDTVTNEMQELGAEGTVTKLGAYQYDIQLILEIIDQQHTQDINLLVKLNRAIDKIIETNLIRF